MCAYIKDINPLNWNAIVNETLKRRKAEKMTQREHAALANVSIPTMAAFEACEKTLSLSKAFDILRVVGLVEEIAEEDEQAIFVNNAYGRWGALIKELPKESPACFSHGWFRFDYYLEGDLKHYNLNDFKDILGKAVTNHSGWPPFLIMKNRPEKKPYLIDELIECWLKPDKDDSFQGSDCNDFWRAKPNGQMFLIRGYQEDNAETFSSGSIFDMTLPIWRIAEVLLHAERLASLLQKKEDSPITIHFRALYTGLKGRVLLAWSNPLLRMIVDERAALGDEALLEAVIPAYGISDRLKDHLYPLVSILYSKFGIQEFPELIVQNEVKRLLGKPRK